MSEEQLEHGKPIANLENARLYAAGAKMDLVVESLDTDYASEIGLTTEAIRNAAESRLRAARLFDADAKQFLYVNVGVVGRAFSISINLERRLDDLGYGHGGLANVWNRGSLGTHGGGHSGGQFVLGSLSKHLDEFIAKYLAANDDTL